MLTKNLAMKIIGKILEDIKNNNKVSNFNGRVILPVNGKKTKRKEATMKF